MPFQGAFQAGNKGVKTAVNSHPEYRIKVLSALCCIIKDPVVIGGIVMFYLLSNFYSYLIEFQQKTTPLD